MNKIIDNIKSGNYEVVDNQGVSVTGHFTQCLEKEFANLEAKLAEKEKELKQIKLDLGIFKSANEFINEYGIEKAREVLLQTEKTKRQDKISFAVKQLEKVKKEFNERKLEYITMETKTHIYGLRIDRINELIDNQINELKGNVKDE